MEGKLTKYFKYRKINKYLKSLEERQYNFLDKTFEYYVDGHLEKFLSNYNFSKIECFSHFDKKRGNSLQVNFWYYNLVVGIDFFDSNYGYVVYLPGISADELDKSFITNNYSEDFGIEKFIIYLHSLLEKDQRLNKNKTM